MKKTLENSFPINYIINKNAAPDTCSSFSASKLPPSIVHRPPSNSNCDRCGDMISVRKCVINFEGNEVLEASKMRNLTGGETETILPNQLEVCEENSESGIFRHGFFCISMSACRRCQPRRVVVTRNLMVIVIVVEI
ncbi:hypothetical protein H5410_002123 [Solanum commersonii]|uniref:Uncharacterized protein n=1 Tax=Solanum commersonii TaxID=4109 RepID=A0A9J6B101_SOLCO|nr:hypothetical protein H5410_002123 [Solanum commersonii]